MSEVRYARAPACRHCGTGLSPLILADGGGAGDPTLDESALQGGQSPVRHTGDVILTLWDHASAGPSPLRLVRHRVLKQTVSICCDAFYQNLTWASCS